MEPGLVWLTTSLVLLAVTMGGLVGLSWLFRLDVMSNRYVGAMVFTVAASLLVMGLSAALLFKSDRGLLIAFVAATGVFVLGSVVGGLALVHAVRRQLHRRHTEGRELPAYIDVGDLEEWGTRRGLSPPRSE